MRGLRWFVVVSLAVAGAVLSLNTASAAGGTLEAVKKRGELVCGVNGSLPGFSLYNAVREWEGIDVDLCRAVAAAVLGSATKVKFVPLQPQQRFDTLRSGQIDLLAANSTFTLQRSANGLQIGIPNYYDGQAFVVAKKSEIATLAALRAATICTVKGTTHEANMEAWFRERRLTVTPVRFDNQDAMYDAFFAGRCVAVTQDATALASSIVRRGKAADYMMLPEKISKEPLGPYVRNDDVAWLDVVRWTQYALIEAEELGISADNVERLLSQSTDPAVRRLLGVTPGNGKALGLDEKWAYNIISQVGNYGDSYERNLGMRSPLKLGRGVNALWTKGGLMYALPLR